MAIDIVFCIFWLKESNPSVDWYTHIVYFEYSLEMYRVFMNSTNPCPKLIVRKNLSTSTEQGI